MVVIDATYTDCYAQAAAISKKMQGPLASKIKGQLISYNELCPLSLTEIIVQFYRMIRCDSKNRFCDHGKNSIYDKISKVSHLRDVIIDVGKELPLSDPVRKMMKTFVIQVIFGNNNSETPGGARSVKWKARKRNHRFDCVLIMKPLTIIVNELIIFHTFNYTPKYITTINRWTRLDACRWTLSPS